MILIHSSQSLRIVQTERYNSSDLIVCISNFYHTVYNQRFGFVCNIRAKSWREKESLARETHAKVLEGLKMGVSKNLREHHNNVNANVKIIWIYDAANIRPMAYTYKITACSSSIQKFAQNVKVRNCFKSAKIKLTTTTTKIDEKHIGVHVLDCWFVQVCIHTHLYSAIQLSVCFWA